MSSPAHGWLPKHLSALALDGSTKSTPLAVDCVMPRAVPSTTSLKDSAVAAMFWMATVTRLLLAVMKTRLADSVAVSKTCRTSSAPGVTVALLSSPANGVCRVPPLSSRP